MLDSDATAAGSCELGRRRSTFYVSLHDNEISTKTEKQRSAAAGGKSTSKIQVLTGLFKSSSGHGLEHIETSPTSSSSTSSSTSSSARSVSQTPLRNEITRCHSHSGSKLFDSSSTTVISSSRSSNSSSSSEKTTAAHLKKLSDSVVDKKSKCVTLPNNVSGKMCLDFGRSDSSPRRKNLSKPREIALCPQEPPKTQSSASKLGLSFIRRTHSTKLNRSPSILKTLAAKCVDNTSPDATNSAGQSVQSRNHTDENQRLHQPEDEDPGVLSGIYFIFYISFY